MGKVVSQVDIRKQEHHSEFPKLMIGELTGLIVLMSQNKCGTVIHKGESTLLEIGEFHTEWKMETFKDYDGSVILNNQ